MLPLPSIHPYLAFPLRGRCHGVTDEVFPRIMLRRLTISLFPPHLSRCAQHLPLKGKTWNDRAAGFRFPHAACGISRCAPRNISRPWTYRSRGISPYRASGTPASRARSAYRVFEHIALRSAQHIATALAVIPVTFPHFFSCSHCKKSNLPKIPLFSTLFDSFSR